MSALTTELLQWCLQQLSLSPIPALSPELADDHLSVVSGDASFRCYYRLQFKGGGSVIAVHAPPDKEDNHAFAKVQSLLHKNGARVPALLSWDEPRGFLLQEDFGDQLLLPLLTGQAEADQYYHQAMSLLLPVQRIALVEGELPDYDQQRLLNEMALFPQWFIEGMLGYPLNDAEQNLLDEVFSILTQSALSQVQTLVHRDFHSRNLMCLPGGELGMIDFQDAVKGPISYDLVSLLRDCYVSWPQQWVRRWALDYRDMAQQQGILGPVSDAEFLRSFDLMGLQRHIKVLGIFARLKLRDGKSGYLKDLPLVMAYTLSVADAYPELAGFVAWFKKTLLPLAMEQSWYREVTL
jgi:aminoglycoside/choline kinase family phosphotransferase